MKRNVLLVALLSTTASAAPATLAAFVTDLSKLSCPAVSQLEKTFGPLHYDPSKHDPFMPLDLPVKVAGVKAARASFIFDIYHQDPREVRDPYGTVTVTFDGATKPQAIAAMLANAKSYTVGTTTVWHAGSVYLSGNALEVGCGTPPDWAQQSWTPADVEAATRTIVAVLDKPSATLPSDERYVVTSAPTLVSANFKTPVPAASFLQAIVVAKVILKSTDVHRSNWHLARPDGTELTYGSWRLLIAVDQQPGDSDKPIPLDIAKLRITSINANPK